VALAVCLLLDERSERALRLLWHRLESAGVSTLLSHTHGHHLPHVSYAVLRSYDVQAVSAAVGALPDSGPVRLHFDGLGLFRRGRAWLIPGIGADVHVRQERVVTAALGTGADLHLHYRPGWWVPHCTLAPRVRREALPALAAEVYGTLPLEAVADRAALIDSSTGERWPLPGIP
jgi:2'-5' RNA ligase